ncbi:Uncharacterized conserved protein, contains HEPN domain [Selenomonas ruminantium]|uniref:Uncharacterized conserved protein, contains HEPN domain n=1 Tax=Selenomonas ruminantium TaxID=971 RepID=A0A1I3C2X6_SELRU|nr:HepT-like ribonuclease domain-containing protein [Selenomonas ruminantium]SFH68341.1 Uncharacterized conserved protein, contains HEPN domain [Selenomonas ruminantium]
MQHRDKIVLQKIISEIDVGTQLLGNNSLEAFLQNEMMKRAIGMTVINIGELIKNVTDEMRNAHPEVPWKQVAGFRDITAHKYQTLRMEDVYQVVVEDFPVLKKQLDVIVSLG